MGITEDYVSTGNWLFRYRSIIPLLLLLPILFYIYYYPYYFFSLTNKWTIICLIISVFGELIRIITVGFVPIGTSGRNTAKQRAKSLNTTGIYSIIRHPLYLGNYFIWMGFLLLFYNLWLYIIVSLVYILYYERIMFAEERFLEKKFGEQYLKWSEGIPAFIPSFSNYKKSEINFSIKSILRREYAGVLATVIGFAYIDVLRFFIETEKLGISPLILNILIGTIGVVFLPRSLKHYTNILSEKDRS